MLTDVVFKLISFLVGQDPHIVKAGEAARKARILERNLNSPTSVAKLARDDIKTKTGLDVADPNPYYVKDEASQRMPKLLNCIYAAIAQSTRPELVLALWMKEGSADVLSEYTFSSLSVRNDDDAKALFIAWHLYWYLGADELTNYKRTQGDNQIQVDGASAPGHRDVLNRGITELMALGLAKFNYAQLMRNDLVVSGGNGGLPFIVKAKDKFYAASLSIQHALFEKIRTQPDPLFSEFSLTYPLSDQLTYLIYNNGRGKKTIINKGAYAILKATMPRAAAVGMSLQDFLLHTKLISSEWGGKRGPRRFLIRFDYYLKCFAPIFA